MVLLLNYAADAVLISGDSHARRTVPPSTRARAASPHTALMSACEWYQRGLRRPAFVRGQYYACPTHTCREVVRGSRVVIQRCT